MAIKEVNPFGKVVYVAGEVKEAGDASYVTKNAIVLAELIGLFGRASKDGKTTFIDFKFKAEDEIYSITELNTYTDKKTGEVVESKGSHFVRAMVGMTSMKNKSTANWVKAKELVFGSEIDGYTIKALIGKKFTISVRVERSAYEKDDGTVVAKEDNVLRKLFTAAELSLAEVNLIIDGEEGVEPKSIFSERRRLEKDIEKGKAYKYKDIDEDEWMAVSGQDVDDCDNSSDDDSDSGLPQLEDEEDATNEAPHNIDSDEHEPEPAHKKKDEPKTKPEPVIVNDDGSDDIDGDDDSLPDLGL